jgi:release factor glutamine methyltransferase
VTFEPAASERADVVDRLRAAGCVFAEDEAELLLADASTVDELVAMVERRAGGEPLEVVVGWAELAGVRVVVEPGVFVPRRRTGLLVREAIDLTPVDGVVVDLCCGVGAVGAAIVVARPSIELHAADADPVAVGVARRNLVAPVHEGDLFAALPADLRGRIDVVVANVPYVPTAAVELLPPEARDHEPRLALDGGADGLDVVRRVAAEVRGWLAAGGHVLVETSREQAPTAVAAFAAAGLVPRVVTDDDLGATVVIGRS